MATFSSKKAIEECGTSEKREKLAKKKEGKHHSFTSHTPCVLSGSHAFLALLLELLGVQL